MYNCMFSAHCTEDVCDEACPILAETSYLFERNDIKITSEVFRQSDAILDKATECLRVANSTKLLTVEAKKTVGTADSLTYCAICENWKGSQLHCTVYNLRYAKYLDMMKDSWNRSKNSKNGDLEYMRIFITMSKVLIISGMDFVNFKDFESQTLLNLLQEREDNEKTTIVVVPSINSLIGTGPFFDRLKQELREARNDR